MVPAGNCHLAPRALRRRDRNWRSKTGAEVFSFVAMIYRSTGFRHLRPKRVRVHLCTVEVLSYGRLKTVKSTPHRGKSGGKSSRKVNLEFK
ncbi:hypothetical protein CEXT_453141 [Caerostris extrusa]|uniref:Uncharacterized protein n=1 Tax=Caerostris extrusa TaxID=172846 RepID=A0AAV4PHP8_CAEEX|nr:hypothetical protein CEXT_453141 [Caerostris extrusa]